MEIATEIAHAKPKSEVGSLSSVAEDAEHSLSQRTGHTESAESNPSGGAVQFDLLVSEELPRVLVECLDAGNCIGECVVDLAQLSHSPLSEAPKSIADAEVPLDFVGDPRLNTDWSWPPAADQSAELNWFALQAAGDKNGAQLPVAADDGSAEVKLRFDWVTEETLTDPAHEQWRAATRTASATHWRSFGFFRAYFYAAIVSSAALFFIASLVSNLSAENTKAWAISVIGATGTKLFVLDPLKILLMSAVLQSVEAWPGTARIVEECTVTND